MPAGNISTRPFAPDGTTDWEEVFEDENTGLIPLIGQAHTRDIRLERRGVAARAVPVGVLKRHLHRVAVEPQIIVADAILPQDFLSLAERLRTHGRIVGGQGEGDHTQTDDATEAAALAQPCPCCGGRMIIIETFESGAQPRAPPPLRLRTGTS